MAVHGDITEINYSHPTLGSGVFFPIANQGNTYDKGGLRNSDDANSITSAGLVVQKNRVRGFFEVIIENDMNNRQDAEKLNALAESGTSATWTFSLVNGSVFKGLGIPVGDIQADTNTGQLTLKVASAKFTQIA